MKKISCAKHVQPTLKFVPTQYRQNANYLEFSSK